VRPQSCRHRANDDQDAPDPLLDLHVHLLKVLIGRGCLWVPPLLLIWEAACHPSNPFNRKPHAALIPAGHSPFEGSIWDTPLGSPAQAHAANCPVWIANCKMSRAQIGWV
jgi:hypothetical protein